MALPLETGIKFQIPLSDGTYLPGYIVHKGNLFLLVNVFKAAMKKRAEPKDFESGEILMRDWLIGDHVFSRSKKVIEVPWVLYRNKKVENPLPPQHDCVVIGEMGYEHVIDIYTSKTVRRPANREDLESLPRHVLENARFYTLTAEAAVQGKRVEYSTEQRKFFIV